ncbi:hypothetical protein L2E82_28441 [Cichorium intybus]|uniref:Uncharacterized protein n=1 Tax=Cichorium intybus TaxID=13427 RepID=A0ACB9CW11_CICIN|nr:hypothetical protein L2E82_28441 [Cichorium intybus]
MNLRSRKIMCKRQRHSSACSDEIKEEEDIISTLPDALLTLILSFLPDADANRTRILSNRWKDIWAFLPNLHLVMPFCWSIEEVNKFHDSVDQIIALRGGLHIKRFHLYCSQKCDYNRVYDWLCTVVKCKVQEIELRFPADRFTFKFCWSLFKSCNTLVELTLKGEFVLDVPEAEFLFPCLKKLNLVSIVYSSDQSLTHLISGCPVLEELFVERQVIGRSDNLQTFKVSSLSLKRLKTSFALCVLGDYKVVIDAPNLEYIYIVDVISTHYTFTKPLSLVEAHIKTRPDINSNVILTTLNSAKKFTLTYSTLMALHHADVLEIPMFHNLVKFEIGIDSRFGWILLPDLLESMPNLEHITFLDGLVPFVRAQHTFNMAWDPTMYMPECLRCKLKEITIRNQEAITQEEFPLIRYLLRNSFRLQKLSMNAHKINPKIRRQLLRFPRGSAFCRIEFI